MPLLNLKPFPVTRKPGTKTPERTGRAALPPFDRVSGVWRKCQKLSRSVQAPSCDLQPCQPQPAPHRADLPQLQYTPFDRERQIDLADGWFPDGSDLPRGTEQWERARERKMTLGEVWLTNLKRFQP